MAQVVGHDEFFQPVKLSQICLLKISKDETLTENISEIASNGLPGHLLEDLAKLLSANGLCLFESHGILNGNDLDVGWSALCDHNHINRWDVTHESSIVLTAEDRQTRRKWKEFYFRWQFYELFRNDLDIPIAHLVKTKFFSFETPQLSEIEVKTYQTRFASLFEENLDFISFYPRMLQLRKEIIKENRELINRMTKNVKEVELCSFLKFRNSHLAVIHDVFTCCDFSKMSTISFRNSKISENAMSQFKAIIEESCKMEMASDKAITCKAVYMENAQSNTRMATQGDIIRRNEGFRADAESKTRICMQGDVSESKDFQAVVQSNEKGVIISENNGFQTDVQSKERMSKQGDVIDVKSKKKISKQGEDMSENNGFQTDARSKGQVDVMSENEGFQAAAQSAKRMRRQGDSRPANGDFQTDLSSTKRVFEQGDTLSENEGFQNGVRAEKRLAVQEEDGSSNDCLAEYFPIKKRKFVKEEPAPLAACNNADSEDRMRTSQAVIPRESNFGEGKFCNALEDMNEYLRLDVENDESYLDTGDVTFDDALCCDVFENHEYGCVVNESMNLINDIQSNGHTPGSPINYGSPNPRSCLEFSRLRKLKFDWCILNSSSISVLCHMIEKLPDLRTFSFYSEDKVQSINVDKIVSSMLQGSEKDDLFLSHKTQFIAQDSICTTEKIALGKCTMGCYSIDYLLWHRNGDCNALSASKLSKLKSLTLIDCDIFDVFKIGCSCEQRHIMEECQVSRYCKWTDQGWDFKIPCQFHHNQPMLEGYLNDQKLCTCNWSSLIFLDLSDNDIWCKGAELLSCVLKTVPVIKIVRLANCKMPTKGCKAIFDMAKDHPSLERLDVTENDYNVSEDRSLAGLILDGRLAHLSLRWSIPPDSLTEEFFDSFCNNTTLKSLDLSENRMREKEMNWFTNVLSKPETLKSLEELDLSYCTMPVSSLSDLADAMVTSNRRLQKLNASGCLKVLGEGLPSDLVKIMKERVNVFNYMPNIDSRRSDFFDHVSVM
eukprot:Seg527.4 transcript_id=Seg527.4/GoldUCD/mRNA.D3Y31 product="Leucine-rich repeat-containing protein 34" protein_id=Seg527.4/GoldUCD/D3Y31